MLNPTQKPIIYDGLTLMTQRLRHQLPDIFMRDVRQAKRLARDRVGEGFRGTAYDADLHYRPFVRLMMQELQQRLLGNRDILKKVPACEVLFSIISRLQMARVAPADEQVAGNLDNRGRQRHELLRSGCRVDVTNGELASELGIGSASVERAIRALKQAEIIVHWGRGWLELDADLVWCGDESARQAYADVQQAHPEHPTLGFSIVDTRRETNSSEDDIE